MCEIFVEVNNITRPIWSHGDQKSPWFQNPVDFRQYFFGIIKVLDNRLVIDNIKKVVFIRQYSLNIAYFYRRTWAEILGCIGLVKSESINALIDKAV